MIPRPMGIGTGDIVQASQRGRVFFARVTGVGADGSLAVAPLDRAVRVRRVTRAEVTDHWAHVDEQQQARDRAQLDLNEWIDG